MPVFTIAATIDLPGKCARASAMPRGIPSSREINVAETRYLDRKPGDRPDFGIERKYKLDGL
jgi:hypothetical protein